jgi:integrase
MVETRFRKIKGKVIKRNGHFSSDPGAATANAAIRTLKILWNYAQDIVPGLPQNPVQLKRWYKVRRRERHVTGDQLPAFYKAVMDLRNPTMKDYILLVLFTGLRRNEAAGLLWSDLDFAQRIIRIPAHRTKAQRRLDLPMSDFVHGLLVARRALGFENEFVFPGESKSGHLTDPTSALADAAEASGVRVTMHDLRRTFITVARRCRGISEVDSKALVSHAVGSDTTSGYDQVATPDLADAMQIVTDRLKQLCKVPTVEGEGVVALERRA